MDTNKAAIELLKRGFKESDLKDIVNRESEIHGEHLSQRQVKKIVQRARSIQGLYSKENVMIGRMTNFQRLQWQRAGSPRDEEGLLFFLGLKKEFFEQAEIAAQEQSA